MGHNALKVGSAANRRERAGSSTRPLANRKKASNSSRIRLCPRWDQKIEHGGEVSVLGTTCNSSARSFAYANMVVDRTSHRVLLHRVDPRVEDEHAAAALKEAFAKYGRPEPVRIDWGRRLLSGAFASAQLGKDVQLPKGGILICRGASVPTREMYSNSKARAQRRI
jgi:hypothetical protein